MNEYGALLDRLTNLEKRIREMEELMRRAHDDRGSAGVSGE